MPKSDADVFNVVGRAVCPTDDWLDYVAPALGLKRETARAIRRGNWRPPPGVLEDLLRLVAARREELQQAEDELRAWLEQHST